MRKNKELRTIGNAYEHTFRIAIGIFALIIVMAAYTGTVSAQPATQHPPEITKVETFREGNMIWVRLFFTDPDNNAAGFGFRAIHGGVWPEETYPFSSPSGGRISPGRIEYPFNLNCESKSLNKWDVTMWVYDSTGLASSPITTHLTCQSDAQKIVAQLLTPQIFLPGILPIIIGIAVYYGSKKYPSVITRVDGFADWLHERRAGLKEDKSWWLKFIEYIIYFPFDVLMNLTERIRNEFIKSGVRVALSIYLACLILFVLYVIAIIAIIIAIVVIILLAILLIALAGASGGRTRGGYYPAYGARTEERRVYRFKWLPPLDSSGKKFRSGSVIPIKFSFTDSNGRNISKAVARVYVVTTKGFESSATSKDYISVGNVAKFNTMEGCYIFNLDTSSMPIGTLTIRIRLDGEKVGETQIRLEDFD